jgi:glycosyltransferase involved in cell wall biosynthesis
MRLFVMSVTRHPKVSVVMPVYDSENYLQESIDSILRQTLTDFELLIISEHGTDDASIRVIENYRDERIRHIHNTRRLGMAESLNLGLTEARGVYIARMDADDISHSRRLEKQVEFLQAHPEVGVCGTWRRLSDGRVIKNPIQNAIIRSFLIFDTLLAHPTVMMRRSLFENGMRYPPYEHAEDFGLWTQLADHTCFANLPEVLLFYRSHPRQVGQRHREEQILGAGHVREAQLARLGLAPTAEEMELHNRIAEGHFDPEFVTQSEVWLRTLLFANRREHIFPEPEFSRLLSQRWFEICISAAGRVGLEAALSFWNSPLRSATGSGTEVGRLGLCCLIGCSPTTMRRVFSYLRSMWANRKS